MTNYRIGPCGETYTIVEQIKTSWFFLYGHDGWTYWSSQSGRKHYAYKKGN